jgi:hypothetical protein
MIDDAGKMQDTYIAGILLAPTGNINFILCAPPPHYRRWWLAADLWKKPVAGRRSPEKTGLHIFTCLSCGGADLRRKIYDLTFPVAVAIVKL